MTSTDHSLDLRADVRRAYERGRLRMALRAAALAAPMIVLSLAAGQTPIMSSLVGAALAALATYLRWRGQAWGRAVVPGLLAGSAPLALPLLLRSSGHCFIGGACCIGGACWSGCLIGCVLGGVLAGVTIGIAAAAEHRQRGAFLLSATLLASITGVLGCAIVGTAGIAGMAVAVVVSSLPVAALARLRSA